MYLPSTIRSWILRKPNSLRAFTHQTRAVTMSTTSTPSNTINNEKLVIVIAGPTAVGKSDVAYQLCSKLGGMIVSADSVQAFQGVDIGSNKPSLEERKETPHLLVDVVDSSQTYNAAEWQQDALYCIQNLLLSENDVDSDASSPSSSNNNTSPREQELRSQIQSARKLKGYDDKTPIIPVVVGGTMMYLQWLVHGRPDAARPTKEAVERAAREIDSYKTRQQWKEAVEFVTSFGNAFAARTQKLSGQDWYRLRRTLEIAYTVKEKGDENMIERLYSGEREGSLESRGFDVRCFFLCPDNRMNHTAVVDRRCEQMILRGLLQETADLEESGEMPEMAARAIGYRQTLEYLNRENTIGNDAEALDQFLNNFTTATRRYAKQQMQWFRKDGSFAFIPVPISEPKEVRVSRTLEAIERLCSLPRDEYEQELKATKPDGSVTVSEQTKRTNEEQGKAMKFYQFKRHLIKPGTDEFSKVFQQADDCTKRLQSQSAKKQRIK